jgi:thiamine pyrophosphate-dependent acetolactate synthase large subunit-like protein
MLIEEGVDLVYGYPGGATCQFTTSYINLRSIAPCFGEQAHAAQDLQELLEEV